MYCLNLRKLFFRVKLDFYCLEINGRYDRNYRFFVDEPTVNNNFYGIYVSQMPVSRS